jgi:septal ring factor EnvC (AmiA/AmiB activator)
MIVFFDLGSSYINKDMHPKKVESAKKLMSSFTTRVAKAAIEAEVNEESKKLSKLEKELKNLTKNKDNYEAEIKDTKETIELREKSIEENLKNQNNLQNEINEQKIKVDKINEKLKKF